MADSRFAKKEDIFSPHFVAINEALNRFHKKFNLIEHAGLNAERFNWIGELPEPPSYYAARLWEFPFAILSGDLRQGIKVADVGCGNTPFTAYLADIAGAENVTGFDPDYFEDDTIDSHSHFGAKKSYVDALGINFKKEGVTKMSSPDNYFDRVFCISVLEHIEDDQVKQKGLQEMVRILKPGGRLILTFDLGINLPLNNILDIVQYSGLIPAGFLDLRFPQKRFVNYGNSTNVDVFGLVLQKSDEKIFTDHSEEKQIPMYKAYERYANLAGFYAVDYSSILVAKDLRSKFGPLKVFVKSILKKYS